jgi:hypothetical protein
LHPAQLWCAQNLLNPFCTSGGEDWAVAPVGTAASVDDSKWAPKQDAVLVGPGAAAVGQSNTPYGCACLKNCACSSSACICARDQDKTPVGQGADYAALSGAKKMNNQAGKIGMCICSCGGVLGI